MSANTETTGADRTKCKAPKWCGKHWEAAVDTGRASGGGYIGCESLLGHDATHGGSAGQFRFCTPACRDARLPPIAAPAAQVELRKGQVWLTSCGGNEYHGTLDRPGRDTTNPGWHTNVGFWSEVRWRRENGWTATLLADATPETPKPCTCPHGPSTTDGKCPIHVTAGITVSGFQGCACAKCVPPAQEAPKAAPVCSHCGNGGHVSNVAFEQGLIKMCIGCRDNLAAWMRSQAGTPYAGPERLPRPRLAADWIEDCLPESDR